MSVEWYIAAPTSWNSTRLFQFCMRLEPGSIFDASTSLLELVAPTAMKYSGNTDNRDATVRSTYLEISRTDLATFITDSHLNGSQYRDHDQDHVRQRRSVAKVGVSLERHLVELSLIHI